MASNFWIKLYHEMLDDPKVGRLTDGQFRMMINLFLLAGDYDQNGYLPSMDDICWRLRNPANFEKDFQTLIEIGIIEIKDDAPCVKNFQKRQGAMSETERSQRYREKLHKKEYYATEMQRKCNDSFTDVDVDEEVDVDKDRDIEVDEIKTKNNDDNRLMELLLSTFATETGITTKSQSDIEALNRLVTAKATKKDLIGGIQYMQSNGYPIIGIKSVLNPTIVEMSKRTAKKRGPDDEDYKKYTKGKYADHIKS